MQTVRYSEIQKKKRRVISFNVLWRLRRQYERYMCFRTECAHIVRRPTNQQCIVSMCGFVESSLYIFLFFYVFVIWYGYGSVHVLGYTQTWLCLYSHTYLTISGRRCKTLYRSKAFGCGCFSTLNGDRTTVVANISSVDNSIGCDDVFSSGVCDG